MHISANKTKISSRHSSKYVLLFSCLTFCCILLDTNPPQQKSRACRKLQKKCFSFVFFLFFFLNAVWHAPRKKRGWITGTLRAPQTTKGEDKTDVIVRQSSLFFSFVCFQEKAQREAHQWDEYGILRSRLPLQEKKKKQHQDGNHYLENDHNTVDLRQLER